MKPASGLAVKRLLATKVFEPAGRMGSCGSASTVSPLDVTRQNVELLSSKVEA
jgi:hypothetical protein